MYIYALICLTFLDLVINDELDDHMLIDVFDFGKHDNWICMFNEMDS